MALLILSIGSLFIAVFIFANGHLGKDVLSQYNELESLSAVFSLIFGVSAAMAGAASAIHIATLGLRAVEMQSLQQRVQLIESRFEGVVITYSKMIQDLSSCMEFAMKFYSVCSDIAFSDVNKNPAGDLDINPEDRKLKEFLESKSDLVAGLDRLGNSIALIGHNELSNSCYFTKSNKFLRQSIYHQAQTAWKKHKRTISGISLNNVFQISDVFLTSSHRLVEKDLNEIIELFFHASAIRQMTETGEFLSGAPGSFSFFSFLTRAAWELPKAGTQGFYALLSSALVHDLVHCIPNKDDILTHLKERYQFMGADISEELYRFEPSTMTGTYLSRMLSEARVIENFYVSEEAMK